MSRPSKRAAWHALLEEHFDRLVALIAPETSTIVDWACGFEIVTEGRSEFYRVSVAAPSNVSLLFSVSIEDTRLRLWDWKISRELDSVAGLRSQVAELRFENYRHMTPGNAPRNCFALAAVVLAKGPQGRPDADIYGWKLALLRELKRMTDLSALDLAGVLSFTDVLLPLSAVTLQNGYRRLAESVVLAAGAPPKARMHRSFEPQGIVE